MSPAAIIALSVLTTLIVIALLGLLVLWLIGAFSEPDDSHHEYPMPDGWTPEDNDEGPQQ